ncbi:hypothetical protein KUTeg_003129 [Tegillarca granosa]|uniref:GH18 domain-containing protein n=1 Tax=Tegillarca granosa TaxID=220873 RepID=A0ABQ9FL87_TEGGR|nr:hypothetical protein KUTeg_003129 [Tegillarca granosa]
MTYDLHGSWEDHTGENAPLHGMPGETGNDVYLNVVDFVKQNGFGGIMVWALTLDDFSGICGDGKYPLMHAIIDEIKKVGPYSV